MVNQIYPPELKLNTANVSDTEAPFLDLQLFLTAMYDKLYDFGFIIY